VAEVILTPEQTSTRFESDDRREPAPRWRIWAGVDRAGDGRALDPEAYRVRLGSHRTFSRLRCLGVGKWERAALAASFDVSRGLDGLLWPRQKG